MKFAGFRIIGTLVFALIASPCHSAQLPPPQAPATSPERATSDSGKADPAPHTLTFLLEGNAFVTIPAGEFVMGSASGNADETPQHRVRISKSFEMMKFEVTQAQWRAVMDSPHSKAKGADDLKEVNPSHFKGDSLPVENVSWDSVQAFIKRLNARDEHHSYRLPTEAEWEYAARGGKTGDAAAAEVVAWCGSDSGGQTHPIGMKAANAWGLHDMLGNVMEWVQDWYVPDYYAGSPRTDPPGPAGNVYTGGSYRVYRGGAWLSDEKQCRVAFRGFDFPTSGYYSVGFRLVRTSR